MIERGPILEMEDVRKHFVSPHGRVEVLSGVSFSVLSGEFVMVTGPSGSGKTTLLNLASLMDQPSEGRVVFAGSDVSDLDENGLCETRKTHVGVVFQRFFLLPHRSAFDNVLFRFRYLDTDAREAHRAAEESLEWVGLSALRDRPARVLSVGEMQRVAIARAVALEPKLLVADEPTGNLDHASSDGVMECFHRLNERGITILMVTHDEGLLEHAGRHLECKDGVVKNG